ncbi:MAG: 1-acyl-sn-glycerol-3-phosphate acyltransferase, partial [Pirellulaceae bacterium]|nr:1-acyl-sn-glycerol-3-phosphate acyltransferase [Pirellulaceae bacterium]
MQNIISERPYQFVPPDHGTIWYRIIQRFNFFGMWLRRSEGVDSYECRNVDKLTDSLAAGHGVLLAPNHARQADPLAMGWLAKEANCQVFAMASSHLFNNGWFKAWAIRKMGGFSVN